MSEEYVVDVSAPAPGETQVITGRLAQALKIDEARVGTLMRRLPDVVTRPISFDEATVVVERFNKAGLRARIRKVSRDTTPTLFDSPAEKPTFELEPEPVLRQPQLSDPDDDDLFLDTDDAADALPLKQTGEFITADDALEITFPENTAAETADQDEDLTLRPLAHETVPDEEPAPEPEPTPEPDRIPERDPRTFETFEELTPAELQARLRREREPAVEEAAAEASTGTSRQDPAATRIMAAAAAEPAAEAASAASRGRRGSLRSKLLTTAIIPVVLAIIGALAATWFTARPALYQQLLDSARNPAIATAASLSSAFEQTASGGGIDYLQLQSTILITRQSFPREDIAFIIATDNQGNPLPGFIVGADSLTADASDLQNAIRDRAIEAIDLGVDARTGRTGSSSQLIGAATGIEIVAQPLIVNQEPVGAVVVGVSDAAVTAQVNRIIVNVLLFSLIPLLLAIVFAVRRARRLTDNVLELTDRADGISRGELDEQVEFHSNDELDDLAAALERMRVSMRGALERLRRRR